MTEQTAGSSAESPLYFRWVRDETGAVNWPRLALALAVTALSAYLSVAVQRAAARPDFERTLRMAVAKRQITAGVRLQQAGRRIEGAGWRQYERARI